MNKLVLSVILAEFGENLIFSFIQLYSIVYTVLKSVALLGHLVSLLQCDFRVGS